MRSDPAPLPTARQPWFERATRDDLIAAAIVSSLLLPQSLAYALLAGLPPMAGVMASLLPLVAYALLGSSRTLAVGPVAVLAAMTAQATAALAPEPATLAALVLAIEVGALMGLAALLRLDALAALLGAPVLHGFVSGAALSIAIGQLPKLVGWQGGAPHGLTAAFGLVALLLLWAARQHLGRWLRQLGLAAASAQRLARLAPMVVVVLAIASVALLPHEGLKLAGQLSLAEGLRLPPLHQASAQLWWNALPFAASIALVAYVESLAVAQALAARRGERVLPRRELLGLGAANLAAGVSGGMPVTGGFARSGVAFEAGARTRWAGVFTAIAFALLVGLAAPWLSLLPQAVLAATIIVAVLPLVEPEAFRRAWTYARPEALLMGVVAGIALFGHAGAALAVGVAGSIALLLQRTARPHWAEVGRLPGSAEVFRNVKRFEVELSPSLLSIRIDEGLCFTNARWLSDMLWAELERHPSAEHLLLMMSGVNDIDLSGLEALMQFAGELKAQGKQLHFSELKGPVADRLNAAGLTDWLPGRVFRTQAEAWAALA
jgi:SulP family sulfate permease